MALSDDFEVFEEGELEKSFKTVHDLDNWMSLFRNQYEMLLHQIVQPDRQDYNIKELGPTHFTISGCQYARTDFSFTTSRKLVLQCSCWGPCQDSVLPGIVYLHGGSHAMGGNRVNSLEALPFVLSCGIKLVSFDLPCNGKSDGEYISFGWFEKHDLQDLLLHLRGQWNISQIVLWGVGVGASTAVQYIRMIDKNVKSAPPVSYTVTLKDSTTKIGLKTKGSFRRKVIVNSITHLPCNNNSCSSNSSNSNSTYSKIIEENIQIGDQLVSIAGKKLSSKNSSKVEACIQSFPKPATLSFYAHRVRSTNPLHISALILENPYKSFKSYVEDIVESLKEENINLPSSLVTLASEKIKNDVKKMLGFNLEQIDLVKDVKKCILPCLYLVPSNTPMKCEKKIEELFQMYAGSKEMIHFDKSSEKSSPIIYQFVLETFHIPSDQKFQQDIISQFQNYKE